MSENKDLVAIASQDGELTTLKAERKTVTEKQFAEIIDGMAAISHLREDDFKDSIEIVSRYWKEPREGDYIIGTIQGFRRIKKDDKLVDCVGLYGFKYEKNAEKGEAGSWLVGGTIAVKAALGMPQNSTVICKYLGKVGKAGNFSLKPYFKK